MTQACIFSIINNSKSIIYQLVPHIIFISETNCGSVLLLLAEHGGRFVLDAATRGQQGVIIFIVAGSLGGHNALKQLPKLP